MNRVRQVQTEHPDLDRPLSDVGRYDRQVRNTTDRGGRGNHGRRDRWRERSRSRERMEDHREPDRRNIVKKESDCREDGRKQYDESRREVDRDARSDVPRDLRQSIHGRVGNCVRADYQDHGSRENVRPEREDYHVRRVESSSHREKNRPRSPRHSSLRSTKRVSELNPRDLPTDDKLRKLNDDPRVKNGEKAPVGNRQGKGRNTESFDPESTLVRPDLRVIVGPNRSNYGKPLKHDDVVVVPEFFCAEDNWETYYTLVEEMRGLQAEGERQAEWIPWHEGCHLVTKAPEKSPTFQKILQKVTEYFNLRPESQGYRFNWYRDSSDWKPFHHDSAAFNPQRAKTQNITVGVSFGATRELAFLHAENGSRAYFPQCNGMMFSFGRDTNIKWKHGLNALPLEEQHGKGRISIIVWGLAQDCIEEADSPSLIVNSRPGPPQHHRHHHHHGDGGRHFR